MVYIREAHAIDGDSPLGGGDMPIVEEPLTLTEREGIARVCMVRLELEPIPALIDTIDNAVEGAYAAAPDRLYLIGRDGRVAYRGGPGPFGFRPDELDDAIAAELARN